MVVTSMFCIYSFISNFLINTKIFIMKTTTLMINGIQKALNFFSNINVDFIPNLVPERQF